MPRLPDLLVFGETKMKAKTALTIWFLVNVFLLSFSICGWIAYNYHTWNFNINNFFLITFTLSIGSEVIHATVAMDGWLYGY